MAQLDLLPLTAVDRDAPTRSIQWAMWFQQREGHLRVLPDLLPDQGLNSVLGFFKRITLKAIDPNDHDSTEGLRQDRFFAWAEPGLKDYLEGHPETFHLAPPGLHPGADKSYKETRFGEANLQFTFHDHEKLPDDPRLFK